MRMQKKKTKIGDPLQKVTVAGDGIIYAGWGVGETVLLPDVKKKKDIICWAGQKKIIWRNCISPVCITARAKSYIVCEVGSGSLSAAD